MNTLNLILVPKARIIIEREGITILKFTDVVVAETGQVISRTRALIGTDNLNLKRLLRQIYANEKI
jgi:hypothetical protein